MSLSPVKLGFKPLKAALNTSASFPGLNISDFLFNGTLRDERSSGGTRLLIHSISAEIVVTTELTAQAVNVIPEEGGIDIELIESVSIDWQPFNILNPVTVASMTLTVAEKPGAVVTKTDIGSGSGRVSVAFAFTSGQTYHVTTTATTFDGTVNQIMYEFTVIDEFTGAPELVDFYVNDILVSDILVDYEVVGQPDSLDAIVDYVVLLAGGESDEGGLVDFIILQEASLDEDTDALVTYWITRLVDAGLVLAACDIGELQFDYVFNASDIRNDQDSNVFDPSMVIQGDQLGLDLANAAEIGAWIDEDTHVTSADIGIPDFNSVELLMEYYDSIAGLAFDYTFLSQTYLEAADLLDE